MQILKVKYESLFCYIAIIIGIIMIMITPPISGPDERTHFFNSYGISIGQIIPSSNNGILVREFPENIVEYVDTSDRKYKETLTNKIDYTSWYYDSWLAEDNRENVKINYWGIDTHPFSYFFSSLGMFLYRTVLSLLGLSSYLSVYNLIMVGKLFNLAYYVVTIYTAIKWIPIYKNLLFLLALMPMSLYQGASLSYDAILIPTCFLLTAFIIKKSWEDIPVCKKDIALVIIFSIFLFCIKQVYVFLLLPLFSIPKKRFENRKKYITCILITIIVGVLAYFPFTILVSHLGIVVENIYLQDEQLNYVLSNPLSFIVAMGNALDSSSGFYRNGFFGIFGNLDTNFPVLFQFGYYIVLLITLLSDSVNSLHLNLKFKILTLFAIIFSLVSIFFALYITWTPLRQGVGADFVDGVQGRYFIPLALFVACVFSGKYVENKILVDKINNITNNVVICTSVIYPICSIILLLIRYWI